MAGNDPTSESLTNGSPMWLPLMHAPPLADDVAQVWLADVEQLRPALDHFAALLSDDEQRRAATFLRTEDRQRFTLTRALLRLLLGEYLCANPAALRFRTGAHGKPALASPTSPITFNVSHAHLRILIAFAWGREVGVDIERVEDQGDGYPLAADFFSAEERAALDVLPAEERAGAFYRCWTRKESYLKATGAGLTTPLGAFTVPLLLFPPSQPHLLSESSAHNARRWELHDLLPIECYATSLAIAHTPRTPIRIMCMRYEPQP